MSGISSPNSLIDKTIGSAFATVADVAGSLPQIRHVSANMEELFIKADSITANLDVMAAAVTSSTTAAAAALASETVANAAATAANTSKDAAATFANAANLSAIAAKNSEDNAAASEVLAATSKAAAKVAEDNAQAHEAAAASYAANALASENVAETSKDAALISETAAKASEIAAATSATSAQTSANAASNSAIDAANSENNASIFANTANASADSAGVHAANASTSATAAASSATAASISAASAAASQTDAANLANAAASSASAANTSANAANTSKLAATASETNAAASATAAAGYATNSSNSATQASTYATNAQTSANAAGISASAAATSATDAATSATNAANALVASVKYTEAQSLTTNQQLQARANINAQVSLGFVPENSANKGVANGYAGLGADGKVPAAQLPSFVDDVLEAANYAALPGLGESGKIYVTLGTNKTYRWSGSAYVEISASPGSTDAVPEGAINLYFTAARAQAAVTSVTGNAGTATKLATGRTIAMTGDVTWTSPVFDGSGNVTAAATLSNTGVAAGTYPKVTVDAKGRVTSGASLIATDIPALDWSKITTGKPTTLAGYGITDAPTNAGVGASGTWGISVSGNAATATKLATARTISLTGDVTGSVAFDGTGNVSITTTVADDSHAHIIGDVDGLQTALDAKLSLAGGTMTGPIIVASGVNVRSLKVGEYESICLKSHGNHVWLRSSANAWTFQGESDGDNWNRVFQLKLPIIATENTNAYLAELGQGESNGVNGAFKGIRIVKYENSAVVDGDLQVGTIVSSGVSAIANSAPTADHGRALTIGNATPTNIFALLNVQAGGAYNPQTVTGDRALLAGGHATYGFVVGQHDGASLRFTAGAITSNAPLTSTRFIGPLTGNASTATTLATARTINGTSFNGSANITTAAWGTARTLTIGATGKSVNGSANVSWSLTEIGAPSLTGTGASGTWGISITGNAASATKLQTACTINNVSFDGSANITVYDSTKMPTAGGTFTGLVATRTATGNTSTASTVNAFEIKGDATYAAVMSFHRSGAYGINMGLDNDNVFRIGGWSASANRLQMDMSGNLTMAGNVTAYSDERLKKNWRSLSDNIISHVAQIRSGIYDRIDSGETQVGVSAQALQAVLPQAVTQDKDGMLSVAYGNAALALVVELSKEIVKLKNELISMRLAMGV